MNIKRMNNRYKHLTDVNGYSQVRLYADVDLKTNVALKVMGKQISNELKNYVERLDKIIGSR